MPAGTLERLWRREVRRPVRRAPAPRRRPYPRAGEALRPVGKVVGGPPQTVQAGPASVIHPGDHALGIPGTEAGLDALAEPVDGHFVVPDVRVGEPGSVVEPYVVRRAVQQRGEEGIRLLAPAGKEVQPGDVGVGVGPGPVACGDRRPECIDGLVVTPAQHVRLGQTGPDVGHEEGVGGAGVGQGLPARPDDAFPILTPGRRVDGIAERVGLAGRLRGSDGRVHGPRV